MLKLFYFHILCVAKLAKLPHFMDDCHFSYIMKVFERNPLACLLACVTKKAPKDVEKPFVLPKNVTAYACTFKAHNNCTCKPKPANVRPYKA
jgi:hypothetical protein